MNFEEYNFIKNIWWGVGDLGKTDGITGASLDYKKGDRINITINRSLLDDPTKLMITVGHELQHAMYWYTERMGSWIDKYTWDGAEAIFEYQAYLWEVANYLAGHRYISATEAYKQNEMEGLAEEVNQFHPLG